VGAQLLIVSIVALGALLLAAAAIPTSVLPRGEIGQLVHDRRPDLALLGAATLGVVAVAYLAVHFTS
jgi:hypothetical protein